MILPMKHWRLGILLFLILSGGNSVRADELLPMEQKAEEPSVAEQIAMKFARGTVNFTTGWAELPKQIYLVGHREGLMMGALRGPIDGLGMFIARTIAGVYEVLTFPVPLPPQYQPMLKPDYIWQPEPVVEPDQSTEPTSLQTQPEPRQP